MNRKTLLVVCCLGVALTAGLMWHFLRADAETYGAPAAVSQAMPQSPSSAEIGKGPGGAPAVAAVEREAVASTDPAAFLAPPDRPSLMAHVEADPPALPPPSRVVTAEEATLFDARSPDDASWLNAHGYPSWREVDGLDALSEQSLATRAAAGDLGAQVLLGMKQNKQQRYRNGYSNIGDAAARGSTFALAALARDQLDSGNVIESAAWRRVAAMRGDWRAGEFVGYQHQGLDAFQMQQADQYAIRYLLNLEQRRRELGYPPFNNTLRPGFDWRRPRLGEQVGVYDRPGG